MRDSDSQLIWVNTPTSIELSSGKAHKTQFIARTSIDAICNTIIAKALVSCLVDCGESMIEKCDDRTPYSKLSIASTVVQSLLTHIIINYKTAEFSVGIIRRGF